MMFSEAGHFDYPSNDHNKYATTSKLLMLILLNKTASELTTLLSIYIDHFHKHNKWLPSKRLVPYWVQLGY